MAKTSKPAGRKFYDMRDIPGLKIWAICWHDDTSGVMLEKVGVRGTQVRYRFFTEEGVTDAEVADIVLLPDETMKPAVKGFYMSSGAPQYLSAYEEQ